MKRFYIPLLILIGLVAAQCGPTPTPETIVQEKEVIVTVEVEKEVAKEVIVTVEVEKEVAKEVVVTATPSPTPSPPEDVLRIAMPDLAEAVEFDPHQSPFVPALAVTKAVYETLVDYDFETGEIVPGVAESWEISEDGSQIVFTLREGAKFSSGNPVNAEAVVWSLQRPFKQEAYLLYQISGFLNAESAEALDEQTVRVTLNQPTSVALAGFTSAPTAIIDPAVMEFDKDGDLGFEYLNSHSMGSGPYMIDEVALGQRLSLIPNPHYNGPYPAQLGQILLTNVPEAGQQLFQLENGDIDVAAGLTAEQIDLFRNREGFQVITGEDTAVSYLSLNMGHPPLDDVRVRRAICMAINYEAIMNDLLPNQVVLASGIIPRGLLGYTDAFTPKQDLELAKSLLEEAGYADGFEFDLWVTTDPIRALAEPEANIGLVIQSDLAQLGIQANVIQQDISTLFPRYRAGELDSIWWDWSPSFADPDSLITPHGDINSSGGQRTGWGCDEGVAGSGCAQTNVRPEAVQVTALIEQARAELDNQKRSQIYEEAQRLIVEEGPYCFFFQSLSSHVATDRVQKYIRHPFNIVDLRPVSLTQ